MTGFSINVKQRIKEFLVQLRIPSVSRRMKPVFFIIGEQKCGTTSLYRNLVSHPMVKAALAKEIRYFDINYDRGIDWYRAHFPLDRSSAGMSSQISPQVRTAEEGFITGEASPSYLFDPHTPRRLKAFCSDAGMIVLLRNPVDRAHSHYQHAVRYWGEKASFEEAMQLEDERIRVDNEMRMQDENHTARDRLRYSYRLRGIYLKQLSWWFDEFDKKQILILKSEDMFNNPEKILAKGFDFLGLPDWRPKRYKRININPYMKMDRKTRNWLYDYYEPHNMELYDFLGESFNWEEGR